MPKLESIIELRIDTLPNGEYGWNAGFSARPGDCLDNELGLASYRDCIARAAPIFPDNSLVEVRVDGISAGTWPVHALHQTAPAVATEVDQRIGALLLSSRRLDPNDPSLAA